MSLIVHPVGANWEGVVSPLDMRTHTDYSDLLSCYQKFMQDIQCSWRGQIAVSYIANF